jgi:hypothetical protein
MTALLEQQHQHEDEEDEHYSEGEHEEAPKGGRDKHDDDGGDGDGGGTNRDGRQQQIQVLNGDDSASCASYSALTFADWEEVVEIDCEYTTDETDAMWFNSDDYASFLEQCEAKAAQMVTQDGSCCPIQLRDLIGLEAWTKEGYKKRQRQRLGSIDVVLDEQFAQWDNGGENPDAIAELYAAASAESRVVASTKALHLENDVKGYLEATRKSADGCIKAAPSTNSLTTNSVHGGNSSCSSSVKSSFRNPADSSSTQVTDDALEDDDSGSIDEEVDNDVRASDDDNEVDDHEAETTLIEVEEVKVITQTRPAKVRVKKSDSQWTKIKGEAPVYNTYQQRIVVPSSIRKEKKGPAPTPKELDRAPSLSSSSDARIVPGPKTPPKPSSTKSSASSATSSATSVSSGTDQSNGRAASAGSSRPKVSVRNIEPFPPQPEIIDLPMRRAPPKNKSLAGRRKPEAMRTAPSPSAASSTVKKIVTKKPLVKKHPPKKHVPPPPTSSLNNICRISGTTSMNGGSNHGLRTPSQHSINNGSSNAVKSSLKATSQHGIIKKHPPVKHKPNNGGPVEATTPRGGVVKKRVPNLNTVKVRPPGEPGTSSNSGKPKSLKFQRSGPLPVRPVMTPVAKPKKEKKDAEKKSASSAKLPSPSPPPTSAKKEGGLLPKFLRKA